jgi:hypothetical protein
MKKKPEIFRDEDGEWCQSVGRLQELIFLMIGVLSLAALIVLIWLSLCISYFLKTGGWSWTL